MKKVDLRCLIFMTLCCDLGLCAKKLIAPAANTITEFLHIPGGISTGFSLMFLVIAAALVPLRFSALLMSAIQSVLALCLGMTGSMGILAPVGYLIPGLSIDLTFLFFEKMSQQRTHGILPASVLSSTTAAACANLLVFHLRSPVLILYLLVAASSGAIYGLLAEKLVRRLTHIITFHPTRTTAAVCRRKELS